MKKVMLNINLWPATVIFWVLLEATGVGVVWSAAAALLYLGLYYAWALYHQEATKLDLAALLFFLGGLGLTLLSPPAGQAWLRDYFSLFLFGHLFLAALLPLALGGEPFTMVFARRTTPQLFWNAPQFLTINRIMTLVWSVLFLVGALVSLFGGWLLGFVVPVALVLGVGFPFNIWYPNHYLKRAGLDGMNQAAEAMQQVQPPAQAPAAAPPAAPAPARADAIIQEGEEPPGPVKKVLVLMGSPRGKRGQTQRCLESFVQGVEAAGAEVETIYIKDYKINSCVGCFTCWEKTPGVCVHKNDDMPPLLDKIMAADTLVLAMPLYIFNVPGMAKNLIDRMLPILEPYMIPDDIHGTTHPHRWQGTKRAVLFSVCGFPELSQFDSLRAWFRQIYDRRGFQVCGEVLRPNAEALSLTEQGLIPVAGQVMQALETAGRELVERGQVSPETEAAVAVDLFPDTDAWRRVVNQRWDVGMDYWQRKKAGEEMPDYNAYMASSPLLNVAGMTLTFKPPAADGLQGDIQFDLSDAAQNWHFLRIADGACRYHSGRAPEPALTIHTSWQVWMDIAQGKLDGQKALMDGLYKVEGDISWLMRMGSMFGPPK